MSKRTREEAIAVNGTSKKSRQDGHKKDKSTERTVEEKPSKEQRREQKRVNKLKQANGEADVHINDEKVQHAETKAATKAEKARRKEAKQAKKLANGDGVVTPAAPTASQSTPGSGYTQAAELTALPQTDIDSFLSTHYITITDPNPSSPALRPITSFKYLPVTDAIQGSPFKTFSSPTPIQSAAWPFVLAGRDVIGVAETGSGKTLAFAVPCIRHITSLLAGKNGRAAGGVRALMVSPTRELAMQIYDQVAKLAKPAGLEAVCVYGGVSKDEQRVALRTASIVIATPGRLDDLLSEGAADLSKAAYVVLDEADRMLDKGFEDDIRKIISITAPSTIRQTLMFTATWPPSVRDLAATFMSSPVKIAIGDNPTGDLRANARITQTVEVVDPRGKETRLLQLLKTHQTGGDRVLVFCLYKKEATRVEAMLRGRGLRVAGIHGDLGQAQRTASLDAFKSGRVPVLVATDVAARGLDIPSVKLVINVTFPLTVEDYVHRIGRTGRAGKDGMAITLFTEHDKGQSGALINVLKAANQPVPDELLRFGSTVKKKGHEAYGAFYKDTGDVQAVAKKIKFDD